ncbi:LysR family transcriptional regulator [Neokomagataea tanensis]|uniref:LysR family transcriptional regulator n=1 Tax=Neokomagataea tanensis TaxID=661191 RepID=A0A4Y6V9V5_9PROT|nr:MULTISPECIES: LysR family transcriptional regulator [Neokomagataea]QDH25470.1 LysR family transcriptional regulator [Neokomagataea tanensis]
MELHIILHLTHWISLGSLNLMFSWIILLFHHHRESDCEECFPSTIIFFYNIISFLNTKHRQNVMTNPQITFRELSHFLTVICQGGFVKASQALNVSQPSISQSIKNLEHKIGAQLVIRDRKSLSLTEKGQIFRRYAERTLREEINLRELLSEAKKCIEGPLRVAVPPAISSICFPNIIESFCGKYPDVMLEIDECPSDRLIPRLRSGQTEAAMLILPTTERDLQFHSLGWDSLCLLVPEQHSLGHADSCHLKAILEERVVLLREDFKINAFLNQAYAEHAATPRVTGRTSDIYLLMAMVRAGMGIGIVPSLLCQKDWMTGLRKLRLLSPSITFELALATRRDHVLSPAGEAWRAECHQHFAYPQP